MSKSKLAGKAQTVLGLIASEDLGITLSHGHLLSDMSQYAPKPSGATGKERFNRPITMEDLSWIRYNPKGNLDNLLLCDEKLAINEVLLYKRAGGKTIVEGTIKGMGQNPLGLMHVAQATGVNIVMSTGYYTEITHPKDVDSKTEDEITEELVREITVGIGDTGIRAGIIKAGCSWPLTKNEHKVLRASVAAQRRTGVPLTIHPGLTHPSSVFEIIEILGKTGADISRTVMQHVDYVVREPEDHRKLAQTGCYVEYDTFGWEGYSTLTTELPNDSKRLNWIIQLISEGFLNQILISHDINWKHRLAKYGGHGYAHILENVVPLMQAKGMTEEQIWGLLIENPKHILQFA
jgi:phosphotriesterase-related protein